MTAVPRWEDTDHVLCIRLDTLGDVLMTTPAIRAVKEGRPGRRITMLTSPAGAAAAALVPEIDELIVYEAPWMKATEVRADNEPEFGMIELLRQRRFDGAVIFTVYSQNPWAAAFMCYLAGIPLRLAHSRENPYQLLTHWAPEIEPEQTLRHEVQRQLDLVATIGCHPSDRGLSLKVPEGAPERVRTLLEQAGLDLRRPWLVIHPGASAPSRRYPAGHFVEAARMLVRRMDQQIVFTGTDPERSLVEEIQARMQRGAPRPMPSFSLAGHLDLGELSALIAMAPLLISNNSGPVHIAAALGTPVVDLYALTNPQHGPWLVPHRLLYHDVPCKFCYKSVCPLVHHNCLRLVPPEKVVEAAAELLGAGSRDAVADSDPAELEVTQ